MKINIHEFVWLLYTEKKCNVFVEISLNIVVEATRTVLLINGCCFYHFLAVNQWRKSWCLFCCWCVKYTFIIICLLILFLYIFSNVFCAFFSSANRMYLLWILLQYFFYSVILCWYETIDRVFTSENTLGSFKYTALHLTSYIIRS